MNTHDTVRRVALLRGINVGRARRIAMGDLRRVVESLGHTHVKTLLNSGNVVYSSATADASDDAVRIEEAVASELGVRARVTALDGREIVEAVEANPLASVAVEPSRLLLLVLHDERTVGKIRPLLDKRWSPEAIALGRRVAYLWCPNGILDGRLWAAADRAVGSEGTARNLATMTKLVGLVHGV
ncbi:MAG: DUF1697 domain-containing protein [Planctomycetes bacterium]|nr:DUF1697 domain-containing protein [Planctomycetota bacterium]